MCRTVGQVKIKSDIASLASRNKFPNFSIIIGEKGSGKKTLLKYCAESDYEGFDIFNDSIWMPDVKVETVRALIDMAYKYHNKMFIIPDADNMSVSAKNALLKVVEECPNNNKFIMTLESLVNTLDTIRSRAVSFTMDSYTPTQIYEYASTVANTKEEAELMRDICNVPGDVNKFIYGDTNIVDFYNYMNVVIDNIAEVSGANAFKIANEISFNDESSGYDFKLFLKAFRKVCYDRMVYCGNKKYVKGLVISNEALKDLRITGINKHFLFDKWLLNIREAWIE